MKGVKHPGKRHQPEGAKDRLKGAGPDADLMYALLRNEESFVSRKRSIGVPP